MRGNRKSTSGEGIKGAEVEVLAAPHTSDSRCAVLSRAFCPRAIIQVAQLGNENDVWFNSMVRFTVFRVFFLWFGDVGACR